jgi:hypothetical protein
MRPGFIMREEYLAGNRVVESESSYHARRCGHDAGVTGRRSYCLTHWLSEEVVHASNGLTTPGMGPTYAPRAEPRS